MRQLVEEELQHEDQGPEPTDTSTEESRKRKLSDRKRGDRGSNKWDSNTYRVLDVSAKGEPLTPQEVQAKFRNAIGFLVRDNLDITISQWKGVPDLVKANLW